jgi:hypothetical protein
MGTMSFLIPGGLPPEASQALGRACLGGGYDRTPVPTRFDQREDRITLSRDADESGYVQAPWVVDGTGHLMVSTATLMERIAPYHLLVELARGKLNQVRSQTADWEAAGLELSNHLRELLHRATHAFAQSLLDLPDAASYRQAQIALALAHQAADELIHLYSRQLYALRHERDPKLDTFLSCRLATIPPPALENDFLQAFNSVCVPLNWKLIEPSETNYSWSDADALLDWAESRSVPVSAGPLIDFTHAGFPDWLKVWEGDALTLTSFMCDYVETAVSRYKGRIRRWVLSSGTNSSPVMRLGEDDRLRLSARLAEAAWNIDPSLEIVLGLSHPWGDYLVREDHTYSPFVFADTLLRAGLNFAAFELEFFMGISPRGTYCRDGLEVSRVLDLFGLLTTPLQIAASYPSSNQEDPLADPSLRAGAFGYHRDGLSPHAQGAWATMMADVALCKPHVCGLTWDHFIDALPHRMPNGGLVDANGHVSPALDRLRTVRVEHLR